MHRFRAFGTEPFWNVDVEGGTLVFTTPEDQAGQTLAGTRAAFAKVGVLMASARRTAQALHPTNLHVNKNLFPRDTIQSRLPNPEWLEHWLDRQIQFDAIWEGKVVERILHNLGSLMGRSFASVQELNRFRKEMMKSLEGRSEAGSVAPT